MDGIKGRLKGVMEEIGHHVTILEKQNNVLRNALKGLLEEEDVKLIPGYELLKETYQNYIDNNVLDNTEHILKPEAAGYDPLHAPPGSRKGRPTINAKQKVVARAAPAPSKYSQEVPDLNVCLLEDPKKKSSSSSSSSSASSASVHAVGMSVYIAEIGGKQYYFHQGYLYDIATCFLVGDITSKGFNIDNVVRPFPRGPIHLAQDPISDEYPDYYEDTSGTAIYKILSNGLLQAVGSVDQEGMKLW